MKTNLKKYFEVLVQAKMIKLKNPEADQTVAELREEAIASLKAEGKISEDYE